MDPGVGKPRRWVPVPFLVVIRGKFAHEALGYWKLPVNSAAFYKLRSQATEHESDTYRRYCNKYVFKRVINIHT
jgi:hypothetical protein